MMYSAAWLACARQPEPPLAHAPNTPDPCTPIMFALFAVVCCSFHFACAGAADRSRLQRIEQLVKLIVPTLPPFCLRPHVAGVLSLDGTESCVKGRFQGAGPFHTIVRPVQKCAPGVVCVAEYTVNKLRARIAEKRDLFLEVTQSNRVARQRCQA